MYPLLLKPEHDVREGAHFRSSRFPSKLVVGQAALIVLLTLGLAATISPQSLWIDEATTAWFACIRTQHQLITTFLRFHTSEAQMPLYLMYMCAWEKVFGHNELALRYSNLPFVILLLTSLSWSSVVGLKRPSAWVVVALSPFLFFYVSEARPYVAVMATCMLAIAAAVSMRVAGKTIRLAQSTCLFALVIAGGLHMLSVIAIPVIAIIIVYASRLSVRAAVRAWRIPILCFLPIFVFEGAYYAFTLFHGAGSERGSNGLSNVAFAVYELAGFAGLGAPRNALRSGATLHLWEYLPYLSLGALSWAGLILLAFRSRKAEMSTALLTGTVVMFLAACATFDLVHLRFVGRHFAMLFPFLAFGGLMITFPIKRSRRDIWLPIASLLALAAAWGISDFRLRFIPAYSKDDYRAATASVISEASRTNSPVLWAADEKTAYYYGLAINGHFQNGENVMGLLKKSGMANNYAGSFGC